MPNKRFHRFSSPVPFVAHRALPVACGVRRGTGPALGRPGLLSESPIRVADPSRCSAWRRLRARWRRPPGQPNGPRAAVVKRTARPGLIRPAEAAPRRPAVFPSPARKGGRPQRCCVNLCAHAAPLSAPIEEWCTHQDLCNNRREGGATTDEYATDVCNSTLRQQPARRAHSRPPVALPTALVRSRSLGPQRPGPDAGTYRRVIGV